VNTTNTAYRRILGSTSFVYIHHILNSQPGTATKTTPITMATTAVLSSSFTCGWRKLPIETKLEVLSHLLPQNIFLPAAFLSETWRRSGPMARTPLGNCTVSLLWLLLEHPDFANPARDYFYGKNIFMVKAHASGHDAPVPWLATSIQHVKIAIFPNLADWLWLANFAKGNMGMGHLRSLEIVIDLRRLVEHIAEFVAEIDATCSIVFDAEDLTVSWAMWAWNCYTEDYHRLGGLAARMSAHLMRRADIHAPLAGKV
jgi:hypothetical protein